MIPAYIFIIFKMLFPVLTLLILKKETLKYYTINPYSLQIKITDNIINIAYCSTVNHLKNVALSAISIINRTKSKINFYVFTSEKFQKAHTIFDQIEIETHHQAHFLFDYISYDIVANAFNYKRGDWNAYAFARCFMINIIPVSKCIYLDTDVFGCGDVSELWNINIGNNLIAGALDALPFKKFLRNEYFPQLNSFIDNEEMLKMNGTGLTHENYLNSGVLVLNINDLRKIDFTNKSVILWNTKKLLFVDQDLFNIIAGHRRLVVDIKFNKCWHGSFSDCVLRHFNHKKVTNPVVSRHYEDYDYYYDSLDEYSRLIIKMNQSQ